MKKLDKQALFSHLINHLELLLSSSVEAANQAHDLATHEQSKPETQYDTVGLEASYLAHGHTQRIEELKLAIIDWQHIATTVTEPCTHIVFGALFELIDEQDKMSYYLLGKSSGGIKLNVDDLSVMVISHQSPLGQEALNRQVGDELELEVGGSKHYLEVISVT